MTWKMRFFLAWVFVITGLAAWLLATHGLGLGEAAATTTVVTG